MTFGRSCIVPDGILPACVNRHVSIIRPDRRDCKRGYLLSVLTHPMSKGYIESLNAGGSRRAITKGHIQSFQIALPPLPLQKAILANVNESRDLATLRDTLLPKLLRGVICFPQNAHIHR